MLKIKFWRIKNLILMNILEQGDEIDKGDGIFFTSDKTEISLSSVTRPALTTSVIFVRGNCEQNDNDVKMIVFDTIADAKEALNNYVQTIAEYNRSLTETANPESDDDIETIIAE